MPILSLRCFACDVVSDDGFTIQTADHEYFYTYPAGTPTAEQEELARMMFKKFTVLPKKIFSNKAGQQIKVRALDHIDGQGARNFEVYLPDDTGRLLVACDSARFNPHRTWFVLSKVMEEQKID